MNLLSQIVLAMSPQGQGAQGGQAWIETLTLVGAMVLIFYFFLIRPQSKRQKEHMSFLDGLKRGDKVITSSGIWGKIATVTDKTVDLEVANNVKIRMSKSGIAGYQAGEAPKANEPK
jgi:preprotein translocase subunit YajC